MRAVIFDMDGVLINSESVHYKCWKQALGEIGISYPYEIYRGCIGSTVDYILDVINERYNLNLVSGGPVRQRMLEFRREYLKKEGYPIISGVREAVKSFSESGYLLAVASSSPTERVKETLKALNLEMFFSVAVGGDLVKNPKPAPDVFLKAMDELQVSSAQCIVIEDSTNGCRAAQAAGICCVGYRNPDSGEQSLEGTVLQIDSWTVENIGKIQKIMETK